LKKVRSEWIEEQQGKMIDGFLQEPQNRVILRELLVSDLPISQRIVSKCVNEIPIDDSIRKAYGIKSNEILTKNPEILEKMVKMKIVVKENIGQTIACANCDSVNIYANYHCPNCNNSRFKRKELFFHKLCNLMITLKKYSNSGEIFCPNCMIYFENTNSNSYTVLGFECVHCNKKFATPSILYNCNDCNYEKFTLNSAKWIDLYSFKIRDEHINKLKNNFFSLMQLEDFLTQSGFAVKHYDRYTENHDSFGPFDLIAYSPMRMLIFITLGNDLTRNIEKILEIEKLSTVSKKNIKTFAISKIRPVNSIQNLLKKFNIDSICEDENKDIKSILIKSLTPRIF
jgi:hypothetical protein